MASETSRTIADRLPLLVVYVDAEGRYRYVNRRFTEWFGFSPQSVIGKPAREIMVPRVAELLRDSHLRALSGEHASYQGLVPFAFGGTRYLSIDYLPHRDDNGAVLGYIAAAADLSAQKDAEAHLHETQRRLQLLADAGVVVAEHSTGEAVATALAERVVADFADLCIIDLIAEGRAVRVAVATSPLSPTTSARRSPSSRPTLLINPTLWRTPSRAATRYCLPTMPTKRGAFREAPTSGTRRPVSGPIDGDRAHGTRRRPPRRNGHVPLRGRAAVHGR